jgi:hypothetical protein
MPDLIGSFCKNIHSFKLTRLLVFLRIPLQGITEIRSEALESLFSSIIALSGENSLKMSGDLLGVERKSSSFSSGILGMSGYSRSWRFLSSLTLGIKIFDLKNKKIIILSKYPDFNIYISKISSKHKQKQIIPQQTRMTGLIRQTQN